MNAWRRMRALALRPGLALRGARVRAAMPTFAAMLRGASFRAWWRRLLRLGPRLARGARTAAKWLLFPPVVGALYVLALTALGATEPIVTDRERVFGADAARVTAWVVVRYAADIRWLEIQLAAAAIVLGAVLGELAGRLVDTAAELRGSPRPTRLPRSLSILLVVALLHASLFAWSMAKDPALYEEAWYASGGPWRRIQLAVTAASSPRVFLAAGAIVLGAYLAASTLLGARGRQRAPARSARGLVAFVLAGAALAALASVPSFAASTRRAAGTNDRPNVIILAADSLRDDHVSPAVTPHLADLARSGTRFTHAYVSLARTFPSWTTMLTGRYPHHHGIRTTVPRYEDRDRPFDTMAARFRQAGWSTAVVADYGGDVFHLADLGFDTVDAPRLDFVEYFRVRGFERARALLPVLQTRMGRRVFPTMREIPMAADPDLLADDAIDRVRSLADRPFFLVVFFSAPHFPYAAPAPYYKRFTDPAYAGRYRYQKYAWYTEQDPDARDVAQIRGLYAGAVASVDDAAGRILAELRRDGIDQRTIVVVTGDHGEDLFDGGRWHGHGDHLFGDAQNHVPLVVADPRRRQGAGHIVTDAVRDVDLAPTLCALAGVPPPAGGDGASFAPALDGSALDARPRTVFAETELWMGVVKGFPQEWRIPYPGFTDTVEVDAEHGNELVLKAAYVPLVNAAKHRMVLDGQWKLVYAPMPGGPKYLLYDTVADPGNLVDRSAEQPATLARLRAELWRWMLEDPKMEERHGFLAPRGVPIDAIDGPPP